MSCNTCKPQAATQPCHATEQRYASRRVGVESSTRHMVLSPELWNNILEFSTSECLGWYYCFDERDHLLHSHTCCRTCDRTATSGPRGFYDMPSAMQQRAFYACEDCRTIRALTVVSKEIQTLVSQRRCDNCGCVLAESAPRAEFYSSDYCIPCGRRVGYFKHAHSS